ncbi:RagB/SusD family nutrient uptake outer membrane protein [Chitinophaga sp. G-6-1-13]|uniref:RagB/SusD family nutrient uptake outer membrane protein n=1 Tax=Chitinophaga fulva TaxID=2728842 RepID=A0A848GNS7_9BACT|nr:RagB/SusD family nutrient uptake outer membrane protein [Chitinophaga fulva]NML39607.1 RagB/SusD family nutrient uptake outer membrane protein [Chitinophaga fulva]
MKRIKLSLYSLLLIGILGSLSSCKKYLDNEVKNGTYDNVFWNSQQDVEGAVNGAYGLYRTAIQNKNTFFIWGDMPAGMYTTESSYLKPVVESGSFQTPYYEDACHDWTNWYRLINQCNLIIEKAGQLPLEKYRGTTYSAQQVKNAYIGEAYFLRALAYFTMVRVWGDVPVQNTAISAAEQIKLIARSPQDSVMNLLTADAQMASSMLQWKQDNTGKNIIHAGKGAALSLLTHVTAWRHKYDQSLVYADSVINQGIYSLESSATMDRLFKAGSQSPELIFEVTNSDADGESNAGAGGFEIPMAQATGAMSLDQTAPGLYYSNSDVVTSFFKNKEVDDINTDLRFKTFFSPKSNDRYGILKYSSTVEKSTSSSYYFKDQSPTVIFRLADILLLKAEAQANLGQEGAALITANLVRARAGVPPLADYAGQLLKRELLAERFRELTGEGQNYYDQVRTKFYPIWLTSADRISKQGWLWPITKSVFNNNPMMTQNEWWKGKY